MTKVDNLRPMVPGPFDQPVAPYSPPYPSLSPFLPPPPPRKRRHRGLLIGVSVLVVVAVALGAVVGAAALIEVPYVIVAPGSARPINGLVAVDGAPVYPPVGEIYFVTITEDDHVTRLEKFQADRDPDVDVRPREEELGDLTPAENLRLNQVYMRQSKDLATLVALQKLGYDIGAATTGAIVTSVVPDGPSAGILQLGDTIVAINAQPVNGNEQLRAIIGASAVGSPTALTLEAPDGTRTEVQVVLGANPDPDANGRPYLGIVPADRLTYDLPFTVSIDSGRVGGPSAGLAYTLEILDVLTDGELTGGNRVAVTGTIGTDGSVGAIGGIREKVVTVERADIDVFLVPADRDCGQPGGSCNFSEAKEKAGDRLTIVPVASIDDALAYLASIGGNGLTLGTPGASFQRTAPAAP